MASADLIEELNCSICLDAYTDPVSLRCGHNFCRSCIVSVLDTQGAAGVYSCPECRAEYPERPALEKNRKLKNIVERFLYTQPVMEETRIFCTYCTKSRVPAVKSCLQCEASFCEKHLGRHSKSSEHILLEPSVNFDDRKCSLHREVLKYYCPMDSACICVSCWGAGGHKGHDVEPMNMAFEKEKEKLGNIMEKLNSEWDYIDKRIHNLKEHQKTENMRSDNIIKTVLSLFKDLKDQLNKLERKLLCEITRQENQVLLPISDLILELERKKDELERKIHQVEELCNSHDPLAFLTELSKSDMTVHRTSEVIHDVKDVGTQNHMSVSKMLHQGLAHFSDSLFMKIKRQFRVMEKSDILLDIETAHKNIIISQDLRSASYTATSQSRPDGPKRFKACQVFGSRSFSSGRHYWEVDVSQAERWMIGVAGESLERKVVGEESFLGYNDKSWALSANYFFTACHNNIHKRLVSNSSVQVLGIYLDYNAGRLSFVQACDPIRHLHTFTSSFTEPLHLAFYLFPGSCLRIVT